MKKKAFRVSCLVLLILVWSVSVSLAGPQAKIVRDNYGVAHIYSNTLEGLFFGYGYAAAQDRLYEMEMFRRTFWGRLSEVYGEKLLAFDESNRRDNLTFRQIKQQIETLTPELRTVLGAFAAGINSYITEALGDRANKLPKEFHQFGFDPEPWTGEDVAADFLSVMGFFMDVSGELFNAQMLNYLTERYGNEKAKAIFQDWCWGLDPESPTTITTVHKSSLQDKKSQALTREHSLMRTILKTSGQAEAVWARERLDPDWIMGKVWPYLTPHSYCVVLSPRRSTTGKAMLMGGPQFNFQLPSALYEVGLHGAGIECVGSTLMGYPFIMFGHNRRAAFSSTAGLDNIEDIFAEKLNPANPRQYWFKGAWRDMEVRVETFRIKDKAQPSVKEFAYTAHGPVFYVDEKNHVAFSKQLSCRENFLQGLASFYELMRAETVPAFEKAAQLSDMSINYFFANDKGDIAYYHLGRYPIRANGVDLRLPTPGTGEYEWKGYLPKTQNPHISNPPTGYIANWNNQPKPGWGHGDLATTDLWGGWGVDGRLTSITRLVDSKKTLGEKDLKDIIKTIAFYDKRATNIKALLIKAVQGVQPKSPQVEESLCLLSEWNNLNIDTGEKGFYDHPGSAIFDRWWNKAVEATFGSWFEGYQNVFGQTAVQILSKRTLGYTLFNKALRDLTKVDYFEGQKAQVLYHALEQALEELAKENPGKAVADYRQKAVMGRYYPITVLGFYLHQPITSTVGELPPFPIVDRGTENHIVSFISGNILGENITSPGTSGFIRADGTASPHFSDQTKMFVDFTYKPMLFTERQINAVAESTKVVE